MELWISDEDIGLMRPVWVKDDPSLHFKIISIEVDDFIKIMAKLGVKAELWVRPSQRGK